MRIGHLGPYSIDNAGDVLVGHATRRAIQALCPGVDIEIFAPEAPQPFWGHRFGRDRGIDRTINPVSSLGPMTWVRDLDALVIGGGGLISSEPHFSTFLLHGDPGWSEVGPPAAWNAVGSQNEPWYAAEFAPTYRAVRACCEQLAYASVRNRSTEKFLRRCGVERAVEVVPDPALLLPPGDRDRAEELLATVGVEAGDFVIGLSLGSSIRDPRAAQFYRRLFETVEKLTGQVSVVAFPFGSVYGDPQIHAELVDRLPLVRHLPGPLAPLDLWSLIGALGLYISPRFHSVIAAYAQNVPLLIVDEYLGDEVATSKLRELAVDASLEAYYLSPWLSTRPERKLVATYRAARAGAISFAGAIATARRRLDGHMRAMLGALGAPITGALDLGGGP